MSETSTRSLEQNKEDVFKDVTILRNSLPRNLLRDAIEEAKKCLEDGLFEKDIATRIKKEFDKKIFGSTCYAQFSLYSSQPHK